MHNTITKMMAKKNEAQKQKNAFALSGVRSFVLFSITRKFVSFHVN